MMMGLSLTWLGTLFAVCYFLNGADAFSREGVAGQLFSMGGVYGHKRPILEVAFTTVCASVLGLVALGVCDFLYARHTKARWFAVHTIANLWISVLCFPDVVYM